MHVVSSCFFFNSHNSSASLNICAINKMQTIIHLPLILYHNLCLSASLQQAQAVTLTVAQAFRVAFEFWQAAKEGTLGHPRRPRECDG